jgi:S-formylglutathione hydrolase FrmB
MIFNKTNLTRFYFVLIFFQIAVLGYSQSQEKAAFVHVVDIPSKTMNKTHKAMVFLPDDYFESDSNFPSVYLLHGYSGYYDDWHKREPKLQQYATEYGVIIITPEGNFDRWYIDSPVDTASKYGTYIGFEVPEWIDTHFRTRRERKFRAITGLSMGGHGALTIAADYSYRFGAAGSMSGILDLRPNSEKLNLRDILGNIDEKPSVWFLHSFYGKVFRLDPKMHPAIIIDCGDSDHLLESNIKVHDLLTEKNIDHEFSILPGEHNWDYWLARLPEHLEFFKFHFRE